MATMLKFLKCSQKFSRSLTICILSSRVGASISEQIRKVKRGAHIVVATPGRLLDMIDRKAVNLSEVKYVVLDEADEMLNMGFVEEVEKILSMTPPTLPLAQVSGFGPSRP